MEKMELGDDGVFTEINEQNKNIATEAIAQNIGENKDNGVLFPYGYVSSLESYQLKKLGLKPCPYRMKIRSEGRFGGTRFKIDFKFINHFGSVLPHKKIRGCIYDIEGNQCVVHKQKYDLIKNIEKLNMIKGNVERRGIIFEKIKSHLPEDVILENNTIGDIEIYNIVHFSLDVKNHETFEIVPEINIDNNTVTPVVSKKFKEEFCKGKVGQGRKIHDCYIVYSDSIKSVFRLSRMLI